MRSLANIFIVAVFLACFAESSLAVCKADLKLWAAAWVSSNQTSFKEMTEYSGRGLNDLGLYHPCNEVKGANYVIFEFSYSPALVVGLCLPENCTVEDYWTLLEGNSTELTARLVSYTAELVRNTEIELAPARRLANAAVPVTDIVLPKHHIHGASDFTASAVLMLLFCVLLLAVSVIGTLLDLNNSATDEMRASIASENSGDATVLGDKSMSPVWAQVFMCFSLTGNASRLFSTKEEKKKDPLDMLNALRVLSIGWVVLGHTNLFRASFSVIYNYMDIKPSFSHFYFTFLYNATYAVDTFFWISGFLQGYLMTNQVVLHKRINWFMIVVHRLIRILPVYMFVMLFGWSLAKYAGDGPKWYNAEYIMHSDCKRYFWTYPLFINNFVLPKTTNNCLVGSWYLPNDMQFFLISLPIMYLYVKSSRIFGWGLLSMCVGFTMIAGGSIYYNEHFEVNYLGVHNRYFMNDYYYKPYTRIAPYCIGLLAGFIYHAYKKNKLGEEFDPLASWFADVINKSQAVRFVLYALGLFFINFFMFIQYNAYQPGDEWSRSGNAAFAAFNKLGYSLGLTFIILPMTMGHLSWARVFFESNWWGPPSKLVFGVYLMHMVVGQVYLFSQPVSYFWDPLNTFKDSLFILVLAFLFVIPLHLIVEVPTVNLEKIIFRR
jgi:peptidoglycan/LPS O-acetylase OafA/YrhL